jgi:uncharacterized protein (TIGR03000 family)
MFQKMFRYGGTLLIAATVILATPSLGLAQHGGGHGGGGFGGGGRGGGGFGGGHFSGGNMGGGHFGGFERGHGDFGRGHDFGRDGFRSFVPFGFYGYPYDYGYGYDPYYYDSYPYSSSSPTYDQSYEGPYTALMPNEADNMAHLTLNVPTDAQIFVDGTATSSTGPVRRFHSPPLTPGQNYTYNVEARWNDNGREVTQTQRVDVSAGARSNVNFPDARATAPQMSKVQTQPTKLPAR